ncbi:hypothetical protein EV421DRAFT_2041320 [Armillaria borealis]|uniref:Heterokaryon incompatibility domain-containing protein n=1 Tax=Armillaria borealis TaxID=47425 RepID=A0AA39IVN0_9AGAR|nr:hypothetical protein EV421DRAFT_2041320 [Armillaria borealis]
MGPTIPTTGTRRLNPPLSEPTALVLHQVDSQRSSNNLEKIKMDGKGWYEHYKRTDVDREFEHEQYQKIYRKYESLTEMTLSAFTETVPKQKSYTGRKPIISSSVADTLCAKLGVVGILQKLNIILGTSYTQEMRSLCSLLEGYIIKGYDFGTAFSYLRPFWYNGLLNIEDKLHTREAWDQQMRQDVLVNNKIISPLLPPRHVWDLFSNRVVPWWAARKYPWAISHAWMKEEDRVDMRTPINGYEWPVPMPRDANLDLIRIEMLNNGAQYAWLDVLCLRQVDGRREDLRAEERVVCYLSGLGRPFSLKENDLESDTYWFRRAWTLQEARHGMTIGGDTGDHRFIEKEMRATVENRLSSLEQGASLLAMPVFIALSEMRKRVSTNPLDRVAGLSYLVCMGGIPAYFAEQSEEEAWMELVNKMAIPHRQDLFFLYPQPGNGNMFWRPSWKQAMDGVLLPPQLSGRNSDWHEFVLRTKAKDADRCDGPCIESGYVWGLSQGSPEENYREGELIIKDTTGAKHTFKIIADHQHPIPEGLYALVGTRSYYHRKRLQKWQFWVAGQRLPGQMFKKLSVFQIPNKKDVKRLHKLGVTRDTKIFLA